ncbi:folylpolyglutamate synthase/dihydrofolate synthase family protein [uncultured Sneathiella sp.]|uniref:bifunctional folylpolyglutamate synthase/dihydrofolate synthase n=1 Tax=uncultured Sneathiella sp. TaxID=879315 RepID=UPI0030EF21B2|tara:strand:+ start:14226 stop:15527 length:1302 start_codon:yes stop_codon:yes gene_type:complete
MTGNNSDRILARMMALHPKVIDLTLDRMLPLLAKLDHPERRLPPVLHVAGTNGKGSLLAYLRAMLEAAGYRAHVYTSPHLVRFAERIRLAGKIIEEDALSDLLLDCETANGDTPITYFEITTIAAFKAFAETPGDILLLETGLGGRFDATNVVARPALTAITPISHDHADFLGTDLAGIAGEKAGIIKPDVPVVIGPQDPVALDVLGKTAEKLRSQPYIYDREWSCRRGDDGWEYRNESGARLFPAPALHGLHQVENAATAVACLDKLGGFTVSDADIAEGLQTVEWPARMQRLTNGPIADALPDHTEIWLDGGHNPAAAEQITASFARWNERDPKPTFLIAGMLNTKDQKSYFSRLSPIIEKGHCITIPGEAASTSAAELAALARAGGVKAMEMPSLMAAVEALLPDLAEKPGRLLITGSLYLAGQILRENG